MRVLDINPDELRAWMSPGYEDEDDVVRNEPGVEDEMYKNRSWMLSGWVGRNNPSFLEQWAVGKIMFVNCVQTSWGVRVLWVTVI